MASGARLAELGDAIGMENRIEGRGNSCRFRGILGSSGNLVGEFGLVPSSPKAPLGCAGLVARVHSSARGSAFLGGSPVRAEDSGSSGFALNKFGFRNAQAVELPRLPH